MADAAYLEKIRSLIKNTGALDDTTRQKLLAKLSQLTEEQLTQIEKVITDGDAKIAAIDTEKQKAIAAENARYAEAIKEFKMKTIPKALRIAEEEHRTEEEATVANLLQQAASL